MKASVVRLIVIDHLMLNPSQDIYILVHCQVQFYVEKLRQGKVTGKMIAFIMQCDHCDTSDMIVQHLFRSTVFVMQCDP